MYSSSFFPYSFYSLSLDLTTTADTPSRFQQSKSPTQDFAPLENNVFPGGYVRTTANKYSPEGNAVHCSAKVNKQCNQRLFLLSGVDR